MAGFSEIEHKNNIFTQPICIVKKLESSYSTFYKYTDILVDGEHKM